MKKIDRFRDEYDFWSNFYPIEIEYKGLIYPSLEHAYQADKTNDIKTKQEIINTKSPGLSKKMGRKVKMRSDFNAILTMFELLTIKFNNPKMRELLLSTGDAILVEGNDWNDTFWGVCNGKGKNVLGKLLMKVRNNLTKGS